MERHCSWKYEKLSISTQELFKLQRYLYKGLTLSWDNIYIFGYDLGLATNVIYYNLFI